MSDDQDLRRKVRDWARENSHLLDEEGFYTLQSLVGDWEQEEKVHHYAQCGKCFTEYVADEPFENVFCSECRRLGYAVLGVVTSTPRDAI